MWPNHCLASPPVEYLKSMQFDLLVIGATHNCKAYIGVSVNARGKKSTDGAGTNDENVEGFSNRRHTGSKMSKKNGLPTHVMNFHRMDMVVGFRHNTGDLVFTY